jgi:hypothetical protein
MAKLRRRQASVTFPALSEPGEPALAEEPGDGCVKVRSPLSLIVGACVLGACVLGAGVAACGGGSTTSSPAPAGTPPASSPPVGSASAGSASASSSGAPAGATGSAASAGARAQVKANWTAFFDPRKPVAKRVSLLQDGPQFAAIITAQAGAGLPSEASAKVTKVVVESATQAKVTYSILLKGQTVLPDQSGTAILQDGTWKVGVASYCGLLALEGGGSSQSLPAAC